MQRYCLGGGFKENIIQLNYNASPSVSHNTSTCILMLQKTQVKTNRSKPQDFYFFPVNDFVRAPRPRPSRTPLIPSPPSRLSNKPPRPRTLSSLPTKPRTPLSSRPTAARIWPKGSTRTSGMQLSGHWRGVLTGQQTPQRIQLLLRMWHSCNLLL